MKSCSLLAGAAVLLLCACGDNDNMQTTPVTPPPPPVEMKEYQFSIKVINLTEAQPMSPIALALHQAGQWWQLGMPASIALEQMAEGGDNSALLAMPEFAIQASASSPLPPGETQEFTLTSESLENMKLSLVTMMVNSNDGFTGLNNLDVSDFTLGDMRRLYSVAYDAGTEANSEDSGTIPGPADGGEGFNSERDDINVVTMHAGVVGRDDGLPLSVLSSVHKFDNPLLAITVTRTK
ncbi:spondin domain-containing protein [Pseudoalteromonas fenneropenaei]|uniref:Spondin domain-containing protein n=1 Tax=Pseudoalteromonas fenneropenaei TaxID=1737459 RepID=A0ABV7CIA1_9GAMM